MLSDEISNLIQRIYAGANDTELWDQAIMEMLRRTSSRFAFLSAVDLSDRQYSHSKFYGPDEAYFLDAIDAYRSHAFRDDPLLAYARRHPNAGFVDLAEAVGGNRSDYDDDVYVRWQLAHFRSGNSVVHYTPMVDHLTLGVSLHPPAAAKSHSDGSLRLFALLFNHIEQSMRLAARPPDLSNVEEATILLDRRGAVIAYSPLAEQILAESDGLDVSTGHIATGACSVTRLIEKTVHRALEVFNEGTDGGAVFIQRPSGRRPYLLSIRPVVIREGLVSAFEAAVIVRIYDAGGSGDCSKVKFWASVYRLSPAEAKIALAIVQGQGSIRDISEQLGIAYATARVQLASIFDKVQVSSQAQLVVMLTR